MVVFQERKHEGVERINYVINMVDRIPSGGSVSSGAGTLEDPDGNRATITTAVAVSGDLVTATVLASEIDETGDWKLDVDVTLSNSEVVRGRFPIKVTVTA